MTRLPISIGVLVCAAAFGWAPGSSPGTLAQQKGGSVDLVQVQLLVPKKITIGKTFRVMDRVENQGNSVALDTVTGFYVSEDDRWDEKDALVGARRVPALGGQEAHEQVSTVKLPPKIATGNHYFLAVADGRRRLEERYRENNTRAVPILVLPAESK